MGGLGQAERGWREALGITAVLCEPSRVWQERTQRCTLRSLLVFCLGVLHQGDQWDDSGKEMGPQWFGLSTS